MNFRRKLKNLFKNWQRMINFDLKHIENPNFSARFEIFKKCNIYVMKELAKLGLYGSAYQLQVLLPEYSKAKGRHIYRIGKVALKKGKLADFHDLLQYSHNNLDLRLVKFVEIGYVNLY